MNRHLGYLDYKYIFISSGINSILSLNINNQQYAHIWLCQCQKGFQRYPSYMTDLHDGADFFIQQQLLGQQQQQPLNQNHRHWSHNSDTINNNNRTKLGESQVVTSTTITSSKSTSILSISISRYL